ncbi:hypothetical protein XaC1_524 [Xanthomonas phage XaC1]|nr:hypothetical protein XaC1_524 [Xanthomonas phage XaC1]
MNELETLIHEVHDHLVNNAILDPTIRIIARAKNFNIKYFKFNIYLCSSKVLYGDGCDAHEVPYYFEKDHYFNASLENDIKIDFNTMVKIASILEYYNIPYRSFNDRAY